MKIDKSCKTCEFNLENICESHHSENGFGWNIDDLNSNRRCWSVNTVYSRELYDKLSYEDKKEYERNSSLGIYNLIRKLESGKWK